MWLDPMLDITNDWSEKLDIDEDSPYEFGRKGSYKYKGTTTHFPFYA